MNAALCGCGLGCPICMPGTPKPASPIVQPSSSPGVDIDRCHVMRLFDALDDRHRALFFAWMAAAIRLQGKSTAKVGV